MPMEHTREQSRSAGEGAQVRWRITHAHLRAVVLAGLGPLAGLLLGRPDLLVIIAPLALIAAVSAAGRPTGSPRARFNAGAATLTEGAEHTAAVDMTGLQGAETASATLASTPWIARRPLHGARTVRADSRPEAGEGTRPLRLSLGASPTRWGRRTIGPVRAAAASAWGAHVWGPVTLPDRQRLVLPAGGAFDTSAAAPHPRGLVGQHRSARPGEGSEFSSLRAFQWGDRLKRIHWPRSTRSSQLHVTATYADQDTHVALILDAQAELGIPDGVGAGASSLDHAVRAGAAIAEHFTRQGDRVSLHTVSGAQTRRLPAGTGRRHAGRILQLLAQTESAAEHRVDPERMRLLLPPGTLVVMLSPLVSAGMLTRAAMLARRGLSVIAVDVLTEDVQAAEEPDPVAEAAWRIRLLEREDELIQLQRHGVAVVPWRGPGSLDAVLRQMARRGRPGVQR